MAYESDDIKPMRPDKFARRGRGEEDPAVPLAAHHDVQPEAGCAIKDISEKDAPAKVQSDKWEPGKNPVVATRAGDDDIRPQRPLAEVLERRREKKMSEEHQKDDFAQSQLTSVTKRDDRSEGAVAFNLLRMLAVCCVAIVAVCLLKSLGTVLHSIAISECVSEMIVYGLAFLVEVFAVCYVYCCLRRLFVGLPKVERLERNKYRGKEDALAAKLRADYIRQFPSGEQYAMQSGFALDDEAIHLLARLRSHKYADSTGFLDDYGRFQEALDDRSLKIIIKYAKTIGVKTAASPWKIVDTFAVFFNSTLMICRIANVYHRKVSRIQAFRLVLRWFVNLYVANEAGDVAEEAATTISKGAADWLGEAGFGSVLQASAPILSKFVGKLAEGGTNAYLAYRLGSRACEEFKALAE